jgi:hypothetical protein
VVPAELQNFVVDSRGTIIRDCKESFLEFTNGRGNPVSSCLDEAPTGKINSPPF